MSPSTAKANRLQGIVKTLLITLAFLIASPLALITLSGVLYSGAAIVLSTTHPTVDATATIAFGWLVIMFGLASIVTSATILAGIYLWRVSGKLGYRALMLLYPPLMAGGLVYQYQLNSAQYLQEFDNYKSQTNNVIIVCFRDKDISIEMQNYVSKFGNPISAPITSTNSNNQVLPAKGLGIVALTNEKAAMQIDLIKKRSSNEVSSISTYSFNNAPKSACGVESPVYQLGD